MATREDKGTSSSVSKPFIHKVATEGGKYIFDVNTGEILRVDEVVWEIIEDSCLSETEVIARHTPRFTRGQIAEAYDEISKVRAESGYFLNHHPAVGMVVSREQVHHMLTRKRKLLLLEITEKCNFLCTYCVRNLPIAGVLRRGTRDMNWETAHDAIDDFLRHCCISQPRNEGHEHPQTPVLSPTEINRRRIDSDDDSVYVNFYGGEPLLNFPLIKKCTEYTLKNAKGEVRFGLTTNGYFLEGDMAEFLGAHNFRVVVSLDGPPSFHDQNRRTTGGTPTHHVVLDRLRAFIRKYPRQVSGIIAVVASGTDAREVYRYFGSADWIPPTTMLRVSLASPPYPGYYQCPPGVEEFPSVREMYNDFKGHLIKGRINPDIPGREFELQRQAFRGSFVGLHRDRWRIAHMRQKSESYAPSGACVAGHARTFVSVTGEYYPCEKVPPDKMYQIGSATTGVDEERVYNLLREFIECTREECERCWCLPICGIGCHASVRDRDGFSVGAKRRTCEEARDTLHRYLEDYCSVLERNPRAFDYLNSKAVPA
ncbi:MAG: radical SAM protein [Phycisphaerae bacterium]|nr:radical SAM protein [Phycisphaerae bacterium]